MFHVTFSKLNYTFETLVPQFGRLPLLSLLFSDCLFFIAICDVYNAPFVKVLCYLQFLEYLCSSGRVQPVGFFSTQLDEVQGVPLNLVQGEEVTNSRMSFHCISKSIF